MLCVMHFEMFYKKLSNDPRITLSMCYNMWGIKSKEDFFYHISNHLHLLLFSKISQIAEPQNAPPKSPISTPRAPNSSLPPNTLLDNVHAGMPWPSGMHDRLPWACHHAQITSFRPASMPRGMFDHVHAVQHCSHSGQINSCLFVNLCS